MTPRGSKFPPFIVVERGESLDEWQRRIQPDFPTTVQARPSIACRVYSPRVTTTMLHAAAVSLS